MREKVAEYNALDEKLAAAQDSAERESLQKQKVEKYLEILYTNPAGFKITARMTTNYRCLKNIYIQRKDHRLPEWREFCSWIETLPYFNELINTAADGVES